MGAGTSVFVHAVVPGRVGRDGVVNVGAWTGDVRGRLPGPGGSTELWGFADVPAGATAGQRAVRVGDAGGGGVFEVGVVALEAGPRRAEGLASPAVAICLPTYEPDPELLGRQLASLREQTLTDWVCVLADDGSSPAALQAIHVLAAGDERFVVVEHDERVGFYANVERGLAALPPARAIALCDQDDRWAPHKLERLLAELDRGDALLVHGDARIVERDGTVRSPTFWTTRPHAPATAERVLVAAGVMGASMLFRPELLDVALPFPPAVGLTFHDHWLSCAAAAAGRIDYVDEALQDYVQHPGNTFGHAQATAPAEPGLRRRATRLLDGGWRGAYFGEWARIELFARVLEQRLAAPPAAITTLARADTSVRGTLSLARRAAHRDEAALGRDLILLAGLAGRRLAQRGAARPR